MLTTPFPGPLPGLALKAYVQFNVAVGVLTTIKASNCTIVRNNSVGIFTVTFTPALSTATYIFQGSFNQPAGGVLAARQTSKLVGSCALLTENPSAVATDPFDGYLAFYE